MSGPSFVETVDLAVDARLVARLPVAAAVDDAVRRGKRAPAPAVSLLDEGVRAAMDGSALVSFVAGLDPSEVDDVLFSTQLA